MERFPRALTPREAETLAFLLSVDDPRLVPLRRQAEDVMAVDRYDDGCASIGLSVDRTRYEAVSLRSPVVETRIKDDQHTADTFFELALFLDHGYLKDLELVHYGRLTPTEFPPVSVWESPYMLG